MQNEYFHGAQITKFLLFEMENKFFEDETNFFVNFASGDFNEKRPTYFREKDKRDNFYKSINEHIYGVYGDELKKLPTENSKIDLPVEIKNIKEKFIFNFEQIVKEFSKISEEDLPFPQFKENGKFTDFPTSYNYYLVCCLLFPLLKELQDEKYNKKLKIHFKEIEIEYFNNKAAPAAKIDDIIISDNLFKDLRIILSYLYYLDKFVTCDYRQAAILKVLFPEYQEKIILFQRPNN